VEKCGTRTAGETIRDNLTWRMSFLCCSTEATNRGKAIPLQAWTGPQGSRRLGLPNFKTVGSWRW